MQLNNDTPFVATSFTQEDASGDPFEVVVARGTFDIVPGGKLRVARMQKPLCTSARYRGLPLTSSLRCDDDLVVKADVFEGRGLSHG